MSRLILLLSLLPLASLQARPRLSFSKEIKVGGARIRLAEVARARGLSPKQRAALERVDLGAAPRLGGRRIIRRKDLRDRLRRALPGVQLRAPRRVTFLRPGQKISSKKLKALIQEHIEASLPNPEELAELQIPQLSPLLLPEGAELELILAEGEPGVFPVQLWAVEGEARSLSRRLWVRADLWVELLVPARHIRRGEPVQRADLQIKRQRSRRLPRGAILAGVAFERGEATRSLRRGQPLTQQMIRPPLMIRRKERVRMFFRQAGLELSALGIAQEDGRRGQRIRLRNLKSGKMIMGRVTRPGHVRVGG